MNKKFSLSEYRTYTREQRIPYSLHWTITESCNLRCKHCFIPKTTQRVSLEDAEWISDFLKEKGFLSIALSGGECLTHPNFKEIYTLLKKKGFLVSVLTNGTLFSGEIKRLFQEYPPYKVELSIYGHDEESFYQTTGQKNGVENFLDCLSFLQKNAIDTLIKAPITKRNYDKLSTFISIAKKHGMQYKFGTYIYASLDGTKDVLEDRIDVKDFEVVAKQDDSFLKEFANKKREGKISFDEKCGACTNNYILNPDNSFSFCAMLMQPKFYFQKDTLQDAFDKVKDYRKIVQKQYEESPCAKCKYGALCPSCPAHLKLENDTHLQCANYFLDCIQKFDEMSRG